MTASSAVAATKSSGLVFTGETGGARWCATRGAAGAGDVFRRAAVCGVRRGGVGCGKGARLAGLGGARRFISPATAARIRPSRRGAERADYECRTGRRPVFWEGWRICGWRISVRLNREHRSATRATGGGGIIFFLRAASASPRRRWWSGGRRAGAGARRCRVSFPIRCGGGAADVSSPKG